jgi:hypothetical protein
MEAKEKEEVEIQKTSAPTSSESEDDLEGDPTYVYEEEEDYGEEEIMNSKPNFEHKKAIEGYYNKMREDKKNAWIMFNERIERIIQTTLKQYKVEKWEYSNKDVFRTINFHSMRLSLDGNDIMCYHYMKGKKDYEEKLRKWEEMKTEMTRKKWVRKKIFTKKKEDKEKEYQNELQEIKEQ